MSRRINLSPLFFAALSGFLLTLAFPRWNLWILAWIALVPLFYALEGARNRREGFLFGFSAGFVFFLLSISWLRHVTVFGMFFVVILQALYWGVFGAGYKVIRTGFKPAPTFGLAACWTALELIRSEIPVWGLGWNLLGTSQASNLWIAQLASLGGVYSVSFLVFLGNRVLYRFIRERTRGQILNLLVFVLLLIATTFFGWNRIQNLKSGGTVRISVLQGNIPQQLKWEEAYRGQILRIYLNLTQLASYDAPQLIVWPEAAYPGFFNREPLANRVRRLVRRIQIPVLVGSPHQGGDVYYNSAYLIDGGSEILQRYDKIHLVPFGEYVPWRPVFGFLERFAYSLGVSDFSPGSQRTVFQLKETDPRFSVLICFEDTFPNLARSFVNRGADYLVVLTNDAWFGHSSAPYQHLQASIFRAIENGVPVVRAANTGISGFINARGEVVERVKNQEGKDTFIIGGMTYPVPLSKELTGYRRGGWLFPYACTAILIMCGIVLIARAGFKPVPASCVLILLIGIGLNTGCIRLQGGAFYAKKGPEGEPPKVKEIYVDTDKLVGHDKNPPGKIEV